jgi:hypothetical protein
VRRFLQCKVKNLGFPSASSLLSLSRSLARWLAGDPSSEIEIRFRDKSSSSPLREREWRRSEG